MEQDRTSERNAAFWNEPCGSIAARDLGVTDSSPASLRKFDDWYFGYYPYLASHIPFERMAGKDVLEIGLGFGTVAQRLAVSGCRYTGLDIAQTPVELVRHRFQQNDLAGTAHVGSILAPPFGEESFDAIVAIGCLHHTGDLAAAIENCRRLLRPRGELIFMVYSAYSYRRWRRHFIQTAKYAAAEAAGYRGVVPSDSMGARAEYDVALSGEAAPHTDFISRRSLRQLCSRFVSFSCKAENLDIGVRRLAFLRRPLLRTPVASLAGLDLYVRAALG